jgi:hypothetical protein
MAARRGLVARTKKVFTVIHHHSFNSFQNHFCHVWRVTVLSLNECIALPVFRFSFFLTIDAPCVFFVTDRPLMPQKLLCLTRRSTSRPD